MQIWLEISMEPDLVIAKMAGFQADATEIRSVQLLNVFDQKLLNWLKITQRNTTVMSYGLKPTEETLTRKEMSLIE